MTLRGAILGAGNIAQFGHLPAYAAVAQKVERCVIVAAADLCEENLARMAAAIPGIATFERADELLDTIRPDFVDICAPPFAHRELIELAIEAGCHIFCEKPLSLTLSDAEFLRERISNEPLVFMPGHQYHYAPIWQRLRAAMTGSDFGNLQFGSISVERQRANPGSSHWRPAWRTCEPLSGGGILIDHGTHLLYQLRALLGDPLRVAARVETRRHHTYGVEDTACCYFDYGQAAVRVSLTWAGARRRTLHQYLGSEGRITCDEATLALAGRSASSSIRLGAGFSADSSHSDWYIPLLQQFLDRIERQDFSRAPLEEAVATIRCITAAYDSARLGKPIDLAAVAPVRHA